MGMINFQGLIFMRIEMQLWYQVFTLFTSAVSFTAGPIYLAIKLFNQKITKRVVIFVLIHFLVNWLFMIIELFLTDPIQLAIWLLINFLVLFGLPILFLSKTTTDLNKGIFLVGTSFIINLSSVIASPVLGFFGITIFYGGWWSPLQLILINVLRLVGFVIVARVIKNSIFLTNRKLFMMVSYALLFILLPLIGLESLTPLLRFDTFLIASGLLPLLLLLPYIKKIKREAESKYQHQVELRQSDLRRFRHDYLNLLSTMEEFVANDDTAGLKDYFANEIQPTKKWIHNQNMELGNLTKLKVKEIKSLMAVKLLDLQELEIPFSVEIPEEVMRFNMRSGKLARVLGNFVDNAIDELRHVDEPEFKLGIFDKDDAILIVIKNNCRAEMPTIKQMFEKDFSTKGENRGLGLWSVKKMLRNVENVSLATKVENGWFTQELEIR